MISFILQILLSKVAMIGLPLLLGGAAVYLFLIGFTRIAFVVGIVAGGLFAGGIVYQEGVSACEKRIERQVNAEVQRRLTTINAALQGAIADASEAKDELAALQAIKDRLDAAIAAAPPVTACLATPEEEKELEPLIPR